MRIVSKKHFGALRVAIIASAFALAFQPLTGGVSFALEGVVGEETAQNMQTSISENEVTDSSSQTAVEELKSVQPESDQKSTDLKSQPTEESLPAEMQTTRGVFSPVAAKIDGSEPKSYYGANDAMNVKINKWLKLYTVSKVGGGTVKTGFDSEFSLKFLPEGQYELNVYHILNIFNPVKYSFTVDVTAPNISWQVQPEEYYKLNDGFHVRPITNEIGATKAIYLDEVKPENLIRELTSDHKNFDTTNSHNQALWDGLSDGEHKFIAVFTDKAGNTTISESKTFNIDRTAPVVKVNLNRKDYATSGQKVRSASKPEIEVTEKNLAKIVVYKGDKEVTTWTNALERETTYKAISWLGEGEYKIVAYDKAGNPSQDFYITIDNTAPTLSDIKFKDAGTSYVNDGKGVILYFTANETLTEFPTVTLGNKQVNVNYENVENNKYRAYLYVDKNINEGELKFEISYKDTAGNEGKSVSATTNGSKAIVDRTVPKITLKDGSDKNAPVIGSNPYQAVSYKIYDNYGYSRVELNGTVIQTQTTPQKWGDINNITIGKWKNSVIEGENTLKVIDAAGNYSEAKFIIDTKAPTSTFTYSNNSTAIVNTDVTVTLRTKEAVVTPAGWDKVSETEFTKVFADNTKFSVELEDLAGNKSTVKGEVERIDKINPIITINGNKYTSEGAFTTKENVVIGANDGPSWNISYVEIINLETNEKTTVGWAEIRNSYVVAEDGKYSVQAFDKAGNVSSLVKITIDRTTNENNNGDGSGSSDNSGTNNSGQNSNSSNSQSVSVQSQNIASTSVSAITSNNSQTIATIQSDNSAASAESQSTADESSATASAENDKASDGEVLGATDEKKWSLANLLITIFTTLSSIVLLAGFFIKKDEDEKKNGIARLITIIPAAGSIIFFLQNENLANSMEVFNNWTLPMLTAIVAQVVLTIYIKKRN